MYSNNSGDGVLDGKILTVIYSIGLHVMFNRYALENIVLGIIRPGDKIPYEEYLDAFEMRDQEQYMIRGAICGNVIDQDEKIIVQPLEKYFRQFFIEQIESMFESAPKHKNSSEEDIPQYKFGLYEYLNDVYEIYKDILLTEARPDYFDYLYDFTDRRKLIRNDVLTAKFVAAIKLRKLRQGRRIDRYIKEMTFRSEYLSRLIREHKGHYILANSDTESLDYKLALISSFSFCTEKEKDLFNPKIRAWEKQNREKSDELIHI